ncbi:MAG: hypothetical protein U1D55_09085 [Phycisphaerae bacterium]
MVSAARAGEIVFGALIGAVGAFAATGFFAAAFLARTVAFDACFFAGFAERFAVFLDAFDFLAVFFAALAFFFAFAIVIPLFEQQSRDATPIGRFHVLRAAAQGIPNFHDLARA